MTEGDAAPQRCCCACGFGERARVVDDAARPTPALHRPVALQIDHTARLVGQDAGIGKCVAAGLSVDDRARTAVHQFARRAIHAPILCATKGERASVGQRAAGQPAAIPE